MTMKEKWPDIIKYINKTINKEYENITPEGFSHFIEILYKWQCGNSPLKGCELEELSYLRNSLIDKTVKQFSADDFNHNDLDKYTQLLLAPKEQCVLFCTDWTFPQYSPVYSFRDLLWRPIIELLLSSDNGENKTDRFLQWFNKNCGFSVKLRYKSNDNSNFLAPIYCAYFMVTLFLRLFVSNAFNAPNFDLKNHRAIEFYLKIINDGNQFTAQKFVLWYIVFRIVHEIRDVPIDSINKVDFHNAEGYDDLQTLIDDQWNQWDQLEPEKYITLGSQFQKAYLICMEKIIKKYYPNEINFMEIAKQMNVQSISGDQIKQDSWFGREDKIHQICKVVFSL